ncbi:hypothetical protein, partial [Flavobacterium noncentrifugens]|uniref:hypothetical protein n=1 Tax=Flavobacterium noncentrifugens TaxID=1128970 RepID=UPI001C3185B5
NVPGICAVAVLIPENFLLPKNEVNENNVSFNSNPAIAYMPCWARFSINHIWKNDMTLKLIINRCD